MAVKTYKKNAPVQLSTNFNSYEFRCGIGRGCSCNDTLIDLQLVEWLERIRTHFGGRKITITSAYRCPSYNAATSGAATGSRHTKGEAIDFVVEGVAPRVVAAYCESIGIKGIGLYETQADGFFVHIDTRTYKSFWYGQAQAARTTFGGAGGATPPVNGSTTGVTTAVSGSSDMLFKGCSGEAVKQLQLDLIALKCDCGPDGADGIFGADTEKAVKKFQGENNLVKDGVAGPITLAEIKKKRTGAFEAGDKVVVTASVLNIRKGAGTDKPIVGTTVKGSKFTLVEVSDGWGKLKERTGWVSLEYCGKQ